MTIPAFDYLPRQHEEWVLDYLHADGESSPLKFMQIMKPLEMCRNDIVTALQKENDVEMREILIKTYEGVAVFIAYLKHEKADADAFEDIHPFR